MTAYVAAGCPVCIDGPKDSVAWRLVSKYDAGVIVNAEPGGAKDLVELLSTTNTDVLTVLAGCEGLHKVGLN